jgi:high frequency lysogenization protein
MTASHHDQVLALAGVFQSAQLVQQLAREGRTDPAAFRASVESILKLDAPDTLSVFGGKDGVRSGLELISRKLLGRTSPSDVEMARYVVAMLHIEKVLRGKPALLESLRDGINTAMEQMKFFEGGEAEEGVRPQLTEKLADLYARTISTLTPRIMVSGEHGHLSNPAIAARVRTALLAGIRAAVLWRQLGGRRWQLLFSRGRIVRNAQELLAA